MLLGNVGYRQGQKREWDGDNLRAPNCPQADALIAKSYRTGWEVA